MFCGGFSSDTQYSLSTIKENKETTKQSCLSQVWAYHFSLKLQGKLLNLDRVEDHKMRVWHSAPRILEFCSRSEELVDMKETYFW